MEVTQKYHKGTTFSHANRANHLHRKGQLFYYRRRIPVRYGGSEIRLSLRTKNYHKACYLCGIFDQGFIECVNEYSVSVYLSMSDQNSHKIDLKPILKQYLREILELDLQQHHDAAPRKSVYGGSRASVDQTIMDVDLETMTNLQSNYIDALRDRDPRIVEKHARALMVEYDVPEEQLSELSIGLLKVLLEFTGEAVKRVKGEGINASSQRKTATGLALMDTNLDVGGAPLLSKLLPDYFDHQLTATGWSQQTLKQNTATITRFIELVGDKPIQDYDREALGKFYTVALKVPAKWGQKPDWRAMTWTELAEETKADAKVPRLSKRTLERHFHALGGMFKHYKQLGKFKGENPANGFSFPKGNGKTVTLAFDRQMWSDRKGVELFRSPLWHGCKTEAKRHVEGKLVVRDDKYWLPLLGLYHGNRLEEFAQLSRMDLKSEAGIHYFEIQDELEGNQLKNKQSTRKVPIHPKLIQWGILDYIQMTAPNSTDRLFPKLRRAGPDKKFGTSFSKWFTRYRKKIEVYERGLDYHSFRHGVVTKLYNASVDDAVIIQLVGHEGQGTSKKNYLKNLSIELLFEGMSKIHWPEVERLFDAAASNKS